MTGEPRRYYLDTSAWLAMVLDEPEGGGLREELDGGEWMSSTLLVVEAWRNAVRLARGGQLSASQLRQLTERLDADIARLDLRDLTLDLATSRILPVVTTPRSRDLVHLQTAAWFHGRRPLTRFVSLDRALVDAAAELGLPVG